jgi:hypothetical protein
MARCCLKQIIEEEFNQLDDLHYKVENKLLRQVVSIQKKKQNEKINLPSPNKPLPHSPITPLTHPPNTPLPQYFIIPFILLQKSVLFDIF